MDMGIASLPQGAESPRRCSLGQRGEIPSEHVSCLSPLSPAHFLPTAGDREHVQDMKEKCCYVALDFEEENVEAAPPPCTRKYQLPDGQEIELGPERFHGPEVLFQPDLTGEPEGPGHTQAGRQAAGLPGGSPEGVDFQEPKVATSEASLVSAD